VNDETPREIDPNRQLLQRIEQFVSAGVQFLPAPDWNKPPPRYVAESVVSVASTAATTSVVGQTEDQRIQPLQALREEVRRCMACAELCSTRTKTVFGTGSIDAELCFIGEAPGADEDRQGEPFVGEAGQLLTRMIQAMGLKREEVYICNILKCRPPGNRQPLPVEASNCRSFLDRQLDIIQPSFICCLGAVASQNLLRESTPIGRMRGRFYEYRGIPVMCTYHPASLLPGRSPQNKGLVWQDLKLLLGRMGRPVPNQGDSKAAVTQSPSTDQ